MWRDWWGGGGVERVDRYSPLGPAEAGVKGLVLVVYLERLEAEGVEHAVREVLEVG